MLSMIKRSEKLKMMMANMRIVCTMFVLRKPALTFAVRNPRKAAISIGMTGRNSDRTIHTGYTKTAGWA